MGHGALRYSYRGTDVTQFRARSWAGESWLPRRRVNQGRVREEFSGYVRGVCASARGEIDDHDNLGFIRRSYSRKPAVRLV